VKVPLWAEQVALILPDFAICLSFVVFCIGWKINFPGWSYPYVGCAVYWTMLLSIYGIPPFWFFNVWPWEGGYAEWMGWIPMTVSFVICICIKPSLYPLRRLFTNIWDDWTLASFVMFSLIPFQLGAKSGSIFLEDVIHRFSLPMHAFNIIAMSISVTFYMKSHNRLFRSMSLLFGIVATMTAFVVSEYFRSKIDPLVDINRLNMTIPTITTIIMSLPTLAAMVIHRQR
jgi:hypothetical protein